MVYTELLVRSINILPELRKLVTNLAEDLLARSTGNATIDAGLTSATATGLDTFTAGHGDSLSLTNGDEEYTVDELQTNTNEIDTTESGGGSGDASLNATVAGAHGQLADAMSAVNAESQKAGRPGPDSNWLAAMENRAVR